MPSDKYPFWTCPSCGLGNPGSLFECRACDYMHPIAKAKARKWEAMIPFRRAFFRRAGKQELLLDAAVAAVDEVMGVSDAQ